MTKSLDLSDDGIAYVANGLKDSLITTAAELIWKVQGISSHRAGAQLTEPVV
jgi:hypothetical protein